MAHHMEQNFATDPSISSHIEKTNIKLTKF